MNDAFVLHALLSERSLSGRRAAVGGEKTALVLAVVIATQESTYQKPGAAALIDAASGRVFGLVSGGCLEGDLLARVQRLWAGHPQRQAPDPALSFSAPSPHDLWMPVRYDTRSEADDFLGTALGCRGCLDLALVPLWSPAGLELAGMVCEAWSPLSPFCGKVTLEEGPFGHILLQFRLHPSHRTGWCAERAGEFERNQANASVVFHSEDPLARVFLISGLPALSFVLPKRHRLLICGAGADVRPLVVCALELGFEVCVYDHRPDARDALRASLVTDHTSRAPGCDLSAFLPAVLDSLELSRVDLQGVAGVLVMTHNLTRDAWCLDALADRGLDPQHVYVGLLGPERRRHEVFRHTQRRGGDQGFHHPLDHPQLKSPMGMDLGGRGPAEIAIEVLADLVRWIRLSSASDRPS